MVEKRKWTFKEIMEDGDNWEQYKEAYEGQVTEDQIKEVEKMLGCGDVKNGFATYMCLCCGAEKRVGFSCKSRVCSSCGKVYADKWAEELGGRLINVTHRHITMTLAVELWQKLEENEAGRKELFGAAETTLKRAMNSKPGIVVTLHPYGRDMKVNYHVHVLLTEGGMDEKGCWKKQSFINYETLRRVWQYEVLTRLKGVLPATLENKQLINELFEKYPQGFYVHAEPRVKDGKGVGRYVGRYLRHPAIADSRIAAYDGQAVTFRYKDRQKQYCKQTLSVLEFIHGVVRHIPPKQFKMVRYYGIYAPRKKEAVKKMLAQIGSMLGRTISHLGWRARHLRDFHKDPLTCPRCSAPDMVLFSLTVPWGGQMITLGGWQWLFERGDLVDLPQPPVLDIAPPQTPPVQLSLFSTVAA